MWRLTFLSGLLGFALGGTAVADDGLESPDDSAPQPAATIVTSTTTASTEALAPMAEGAPATSTTAYGPGKVEVGIFLGGFINNNAGQFYDPDLEAMRPIDDLVLDRVAPIFGGLGPTEQGPEAIHLGIPQLRGLWDRAPRFFHDGRAHSLRAALAPPGHPALAPGEVGHNERRGQPDTHGGTSQLTADELDDLIAFLLTL